MPNLTVNPYELRWTANEIRQRANSIQESLDKVDSIIKSLGASRMEGARADALRNRYSKLRERIYSLKRNLELFSIDLDEVSSRLDNADRA